jgi:hypothetical protein
MSYVALLLDPAIEDLRRIPALVHPFIEAEIRRLCEDPVRIGRRANFPYPRGQMHQFRCVAEGNEHLITILFRYGADQSENRIGIFGIGFQTIGRVGDDFSI